MGSWTELDAVYPPGKLSPGAALVVALGHLAGVKSVYIEGRLQAFLPAGLSYDADLLGRAERYLAEVSLEEFLEQAQVVLSVRQKLVVALQLIDRQLAAHDTPEGHALVARLVTGIGANTDLLADHRSTLALKNDLSIFPQ